MRTQKKGDKMGKERLMRDNNTSFPNPRIMRRKGNRKQRKISKEN